MSLNNFYYSLVFIVKELLTQYLTMFRSLSGWNDGLIRAFTPQTGRLIFTIHNSHVKAVSAVTITTDGALLVSGGCDGQVTSNMMLKKLQTCCYQWVNS